MEDKRVPVNSQNLLYQINFYNFNTKQELRVSLQNINSEPSIPFYVYKWWCCHFHKVSPKGTRHMACQWCEDKTLERGQPKLRKAIKRGGGIKGAWKEEMSPCSEVSLGKHPQCWNALNFNL